MRKFFIIIFILTMLPVFAEEVMQPVTQNPLVVPQNISFENCTKIYNITKEKLFYLTLASASANKFNINEIQTSNGYIIFNAGRNQYIATVAKVDDKNSILKITPCNNVYNFPPGILTNMFKYIDLNVLSDIKS